MSIVNVVLAAIAVDVITSGTVVVTTGKCVVIRLVDAAKDDDTAICNVDVLVDVCCRLVEDILVVAGVLTDIRLEVVVKGISVVVGTAEEHASQSAHSFHVHLVLQSFALLGHHDPHSIANGGLVVADAKGVVVEQASQAEHLSHVHLVFQSLALLGHHDLQSRAWSFLSTFGEETFGGFWRKKS